MVGPGRPTPRVVLDVDQREKLRRLSRARKKPRRLVQRANIVLACADGETDTRVADRLGISGHTVAKWRRRFLEHGLESLHNKPRTGRRTLITHLDVARIIDLTFSPPPDGSDYWTAAAMATATGWSREHDPTQVARVRTPAGPAGMRQVEPRPGTLRDLVRGRRVPGLWTEGDRHIRRRPVECRGRTIGLGEGSPTSTSAFATRNGLRVRRPFSRRWECRPASLRGLPGRRRHRRARRLGTVLAGGQPRPSPGDPAAPMARRSVVSCRPRYQH